MTPHSDGDPYADLRPPVVTPKVKNMTAMENQSWVEAFCHCQDAHETHLGWSALSVGLYAADKLDQPRGMSFVRWIEIIEDAARQAVGE